MTPAKKMRGARPGKVLSLAALLPVRWKLKWAGRSVVFTNGCFDLVHGGHVKIQFQGQTRAQVFNHSYVTFVI